VVTQLIAVFIKHWLCKRMILLFLCDIWDGVNQLDMHGDGGELNLSQNQLHNRGWENSIQ